VPLNDKPRPGVLVNSVSSGESNDREMRKFDPRGSVIGVEVGCRVDVHQV
jgi:hypothetical protein